MDTIRDIDSFIDNCLISEYVNKYSDKGYSLDIDNVPIHDRNNFLDLLMKHDTDVRDYVLSSMQKWIDDRLPEWESQDRFESHYEWRKSA